MEQKMQSNRCNSCGGQVVFDPESQQMMCSSCKEVQEPEASGEGAGQAATLECPNCAAELETIAGSRQSKCDSCDSVFTLISEGEDCPLTGDIPEENKYIEPFTVTREQYQQGMISWLAGEDFTPRDVFDKIGIISQEGCYLPYYYCVASYKVNWTASIGYDRVETFVVPVTRTVNGRSQTTMQTRTRVVTDWRPFSSTQSGTATNVVEGTKYMDAVRTKTQGANPPELTKTIKESSHGIADTRQFIRLDRKTQFDPKFTAGFTVLPCEEKSEKAYDKGKINDQIRAEITRNAPGDRIRDLRFGGDIVPCIYLVYRPKWLTMYSYDKKVCFSTCDGVDNTRHFGTRPACKDKKRRIRNWFLPFAASAVAAIIAAVLAFFVMADSDAMMTVFYATAGAAGVTGLTFVAARALILGGSKKVLAGKSQRYLANSSEIFGRRSAKRNPMDG